MLCIISCSLNRFSQYPTLIYGRHNPSSFKAGSASRYSAAPSPTRSKGIDSQRRERSARRKNLKRQWVLSLQQRALPWTLNSSASLSSCHSRSISRLISPQMCSQERMMVSPLLPCPTCLSEKTKDSVTSLRRAMAMGTLSSTMENLVATSFWQTLEMKMPMEEAETVVKLSSMLCGSTCTLSTTSCDLPSRLKAMASSSNIANSRLRMKRSSCSITSRMALAVSGCLFLLTTSMSRSTCFSYFSRISSQLLILNSRLLVWLIQQMRLPHAQWYSSRSKISWNSRFVDATSSSCESITRLSYFVKSGMSAFFLSSMLQGSCYRKPKSLFSSMVSRSVRLLTQTMPCSAILFSSSLERMRSRMTALLLSLSSPGMSSILNLTSCPATSKDVPSQQCTSVVTSLRLLATLMEGLEVSSLVVALLPDPERPIISRLQCETSCILLNIAVPTYK